MQKLCSHRVEAALSKRPVYEYNDNMNLTYEDIQQAAEQLPVKQRAHLAHVLLRGLDNGDEEDVEALWLEEARRRYDAFKRGELEAIDGDAAMAQLRNLVK
jgi:Putative addiction module component.